MWMIKNFLGGLTWICRDKQEHEKINVEIEFKWDALFYHCQNEIPGTTSMRTWGVSRWQLTLTPPLRIPRPTWCRSCGAVSDCPDTEETRRVSSCWLLAPVSFITATSAHPPAPSLTWPGPGASSPWFIYTQGEILWYAPCHSCWFTM